MLFKIQLSMNFDLGDVFSPYGDSSSVGSNILRLVLACETCPTQSDCFGPGPHRRDFAPSVFESIDKVTQCLSTVISSHLFRKSISGTVLVVNHAMDEVQLLQHWARHDEGVEVVQAHAAGEFVQHGGQLHPGIDQ